MERAKGDPACQAILTSPSACASCPLASQEPEEPPSQQLQHLIWLEGLQAVGAQFAFDSLAMWEWEALKILKHARNEKLDRDMKKRQAKNL